MLIAALVLLLIGGGETSYAPVTESLALSADHVEEIAEDRDQRKRIEGALKVVLKVAADENEALAQAKSELGVVNRSHAATQAELQAMIVRYQSQEAQSQQAWLDAYFMLRGTMNAEQWQQLMAARDQ